ncbi:MAG: hypothetical protein WA830_06805, partial [Candidatus Sulfotelmatobacter sp.]
RKEVGRRGLGLPVQMRLNRQAKTSSTDFLPMYFTNPGQAAVDALGTTVTATTIGNNSSFVPAYDAAGFNGANVVGFMPYGTSKYNGLQTSLKRSFSNGLQFQASWTWSHAMDNSTADVFSTYLTPRRPQDFQCFQCDWSNSALNRAQRLTVEMLYDMPFLKHSDNWMAKNLLGNWQVSPAYTFQSPEYVTVQTGSDVNGNGDSAGDRVFINPAGIKGTGTGSTALTNTAGDVVAYVANSPTAYYVSAGKYTRPNARRNTLGMPHTNTFDFSVLKRINIAETQSLEFQAQFLNFFNHAQYLPGYLSDVAPIGYTGSNVLPMLEPTSPTFNDPKAVFSNHPRAVTLVLKYTF